MNYHDWLGNTGHYSGNRAFVLLIHRLLKAHGTIFRNLINDARRDYALRHLANADTSIASIAAKLGYRGAGHFTRAFKSWTGLTPSDYRKQFRNKHENPDR